MSVDRSLLDQLIGAEKDGENKDDDVLSGLARMKDADPLAEEAVDDPYDRFVKELAYDKRAQPSDRLKTEVEVAQEAAAALQRSEQARLKRMRSAMDERASDDEDSDEEDTSRKRRSTTKGKQRAPQGDDLGDEFENNTDEQSGFGLGGGLLPEMDEGSETGNEDGEDLEGANMEDPLDMAEAEEAESDDAGEDNEEEDEDEGSEKDENEMLADLLHDDVEMVSSDESSGLPAIIANRKSMQASKTDLKELPFTFPCPTTHDDFLDIVNSTTPDQLSIVIERIRVLHHPSLAEGNKQKLALFLGVLIDHLLYTVSAADRPSFADNPVILKHILSMVKAYPLSTASYSVRKLGLMQKNLVRGLQSGPSEVKSKTWPGPAELTLLRLIGTVWSTSDFSHPVVAPAMLLISQYLGQCRVRDTRDLASGIFLCTLVLQYESQSKRLVPEALSFLAQALVLLLPLKGEMQNYGHYPLPDFGRPELADLCVKSKAETPSTFPPNLLALLQNGTETSQSRADLLSLGLTLLSDFATMYNPLPAFIEMFAPIQAVLDGVVLKRLSAALVVRGCRYTHNNSILINIVTGQSECNTGQYIAYAQVFATSSTASYSATAQADPDSFVCSQI
jgi:nucleolar protein 14